MNNNKNFIYQFAIFLFSFVGIFLTFRMHFLSTFGAPWPFWGRSGLILDGSGRVRGGFWSLQSSIFEVFWCAMRQRPPFKKPRKNCVLPPTMANYEFFAKLRERRKNRSKNAPEGLREDIATQKR